jgi:uncharacterized coiled-coil DUF342 family protein
MKKQVILAVAALSLLVASAASAQVDVKTKIEGRGKADPAMLSGKAELDSRIEMLKKQAIEAQKMAKDNPGKMEDKLKEMRGTVEDLKTKAATKITPTQGDEAEMLNTSNTPSPREQLIKFGEKFLNRLMAAVERQNTLLTRLSSRIQIMVNTGAKMDDASAKLSEAQKAVDTAKTSVFDLSGKLSELAGKIDGSKKDALTSLRDAAKDTMKLIQTAQQKIVDTISAVKKVSVSADAKAKVEAKQN